MSNSPIYQAADQVGLRIIDGRARVPNGSRSTRAKTTLIHIHRVREVEGKVQHYLSGLLKVIYWYPAVPPTYLPYPMLRAIDDVVWGYREHWDQMPRVFEKLDIPAIYGTARKSRLLSTRQKMADLLETEIRAEL